MACLFPILFCELHCTLSGNPHLHLNLTNEVIQVFQILCILPLRDSYWAQVYVGKLY